MENGARIGNYTGTSEYFVTFTHISEYFVTLKLITFIKLRQHLSNYSNKAQRILYITQLSIVTTIMSSETRASQQSRCRRITFELFSRYLITPPRNFIDLTCCQYFQEIFSTSSVTKGNINGKHLLIYSVHCCKSFQFMRRNLE